MVWAEGSSQRLFPVSVQPLDREEFVLQSHPNFFSEVKLQSMKTKQALHWEKYIFILQLSDTKNVNGEHLDSELFPIFFLPPTQ